MSKDLTTKEVEITVWNRLIKERRDINVYQHSSKSGHIISSNHFHKIGIKAIEEDDYLYISVQRGPGLLENYCVLDLPSFVDFKFSNTGEFVLLHCRERILLRIPPGPPLWEIKMKIPAQLTFLTNTNEGHITIGDEDENERSGYSFQTIDM